MLNGNFPNFLSIFSNPSDRSKLCFNYLFYFVENLDSTVFFCFPTSCLEFLGGNLINTQITTAADARSRRFFPSAVILNFLRYCLCANTLLQNVLFLVQKLKLQIPILRKTNRATCILNVQSKKGLQI